MKKLFTLLICFPILTLAQQTINDSIFYNNVYRSYIAYIPAIYNSSYSTPLLFNLHGRTGTALGAMYQADFRDIADSANFIIVHPQGLLDSAGDTHWNVGQSAVDDIGFLNSLYSYIVSNYNINLDKVYSAGMSNGGYMSYYLACNMSDKIAAIASVTGAMGPYTQLTCNPMHPTPVLEIHGTEDTIVSFNAMIPGILYWRDYNNCNLIADTTIIQDLVLGDFSTVKHIVYNNGANGVTSELFKVIGGEHTWPGSSFSIGITNYDIDASVEIWKFFSRYDINGLISTTSSVAEVKETNKTLLKTIDVLGRENKDTNQPLFYIYYDGTVEKKIIIK